MDSIFENVKTVEEGSMPPSVTIALKFPYSVNYENEKFHLSYNEAYNSGFLKHMLEDFPENVTYCEITIPKNLYLGIRVKEIQCLYELWIGRRTITHATLHDDVYHLENVCRLADALLISKELPFVKKLYEKYTHDDLYMKESSLNKFTNITN
tara:strand:+ start:155 stop:613 length:459 start_codon:yes stop_codon:yes gene_type:complete